MINKIIDGIIASLNKEFGDEYEIYPENVKQGLKEPCFSIVCVNPIMDQVVGKRYFKQNLFCIHYFPKDKNNAKFEINEIIERLFNLLEYIYVDDDLCRGTDLNAEIVDDVLNFFVKYNLFVYKEKENTPFMETYAYKAREKEGKGD